MVNLTEGLLTLKFTFNTCQLLLKHLIKNVFVLGACVDNPHSVHPIESVFLKVTVLVSCDLKIVISELCVFTTEV